jgi:hypothetical protein
MKPLIFACLALLLITPAAEARRLRAPSLPINVRMVAYVGQKIEGARPEFDWVVEYRGKRYELFVLKLTVLRGGVLPLDIDAAVAPYRVKFQLAGEKNALQRFVATPPRQQIVISGYLVFAGGARYFMLDTVDSGPPD